MESFSVMIIGGFTQYKYAWYEPVSAQYSRDFPTCEVCGSPVGPLRWIEPYVVDIKQPRKVGDLLYGAGGPSFVASEKFITLVEDVKLTGVERILTVRIRKMGTTQKGNSYHQPKLYGVDVKHTKTRVEFDKMDVEWSHLPAADYCKNCGPGGGGKNGVWRKIDRVVVDLNTWSGEDLFFPINFAGQVFLSSRAANLIKKANLENVTIIPCEEYSYRFTV